MAEPNSLNKQKPKKKHEAIIKLVKEAPDTLFQFVQDITDKLTIKRLALVLLASIIATMTVFFYENRNAFFEVGMSLMRPNPTSSWEISKDTQIDIIKKVRASQLVNFIMVSQIDLQKNRHYIKFWNYDGKLDQEIINKLTIFGPLPIFDEDGRNTSQVISIFSGDFVCSPFDETVFYKIAPEIKTDVQVICRISIPPIDGHAVGILAFGISKKPSPEEFILIKQDAIELSNSIYLRDISNHLTLNVRS